MDGDLYLPLIKSIFNEEITKFHKTKRMTKVIKEKSDLEQSEEEIEDEIESELDSPISLHSFSSDEHIIDNLP